VGGVFAAAAVTKVGDPQATVRAVRAYDVVPEPLVPPLGYALPYVELGLALLLILGIGVRYVAAISAALLFVFIAGIVSAWVRGLKIDCGCFGGGGPTEEPKYLAEVLRDTAFLAVAVGVAKWKRSALSLDNALEL
jgi:uncharacterized membrane protein YphA (DoxX/SURF4 family)